IVKQVRKAVWDRLSYTCSGGIARNKMISKLGSGCNKPDKQTVVRNRAIQTFLADFKFTKIRMLGGKLGKHISACFDTELVTDLLKVPIDQMRAKLGEETANWLYLVIRGEECSEVNTRVQIKSMLSAKSFRPSIRSIEQAEKWLHIFVADIHNRLVQDGILEHKRRPRVITMHYHSEGKHGASRQMQIPQGKPIDEEFLHTLTKKLLAQTVASAKVFPCFNLSLSVSGFEDGTTGTKSLHGFFTLEEKKEETENTKSETPPVPEATSESMPRKRRKLGPFFTTQSPEQSSGVNSPTLYEDAKSSPALTDPEVPRDSAEEALPFPSFQCSRCGKSVIELDRLEHDDWHLAKDLAEEEERQIASQSTQQEPRSSGSGFGFARQAPRGRGRVEKGQSRLFFG
ncbi:DNA-directed DNA polymerase eta rad30, partial [Ascosphaera atra]